MPHSSTGYGEIKVGRVYLVEKEVAKETSDGKLTVAGQESSPPTTLAMVTWLQGQIAGMGEGRLVPVTFRDKAERNGYYTVTQTSSDLTDYQSEVATCDWTIDLQRLGSDPEVDIQSRLTGAVRANNFSVTGTAWHAPAIGHYAYYTGTTSPSNFDRTSANGNIRIYSGIPANISPKWGCDPLNYHAGRVQLTSTTYVSTENEVEGVNRQIGVTGWTLSNGVVNVTPHASAGRLTIGVYNSGYQNVDWDVKIGGSNLGVWRSATVLRNDPEQVVLRLTAERNTGTAGRDTLDLTLRRGAQFVEGYLQTNTSANLQIGGANTSASASASNGIVQASAGTNRRICGTAKTFNTTDTANCGFTKNSSTFLDFWIGAKVTASGAGTASQDDSTALQNQYIGALPEVTYVVQR